MYADCDVMTASPLDDLESLLAARATLAREAAPPHARDGAGGMLTELRAELQRRDGLDG